VIIIIKDFFPFNGTPYNTSHKKQFWDKKYAHFDLKLDQMDLVLYHLVEVNYLEWYIWKCLQSIIIIIQA